LVCVEREAKDGHRQSHERKAQTTADVRNGVGRLGEQLQAVVEESNHQFLHGAEMRKVKEQRGAEVRASGLLVEVLEQDNPRLSEAKKLRPPTLGAPRLTNSFDELIAVVALRGGGSNVTGWLSTRGLANVRIGDWSNDFTFIVGDHRYQCRSSVAQFLSPRISTLHWADATADELRLEVEDGDGLFASVLKAARGGRIAVDSAHRQTFAAICAALMNSELYRCAYPDLSDKVTMENVVDRLEFLLATRCDISPELEFIASHFYDFLCRREALKDLPFPMIYEILGHGSLRLDGEDSLYDFIREATETNREMGSLLEFVRLEYCSTDVISEFFDVLSEDFCGINASIWAGLRGRLVLPDIYKKPAKQVPPSVKKEEHAFDVPDGIMAHLTRKCSGNVHDRHVVEVTSGSFEKETQGASPHSGAYDNLPSNAAKNATDMETGSYFCSAYRSYKEDIPHTRNNWVCYDSKERRIAPTHYAIRTNSMGPGFAHLKSWVVETSVDGVSWQEVAREENSEQLNGSHFTGIFELAFGGECRFIRLVNIGRNHRGNDGICISAWEIFGTLIE
jgi:hypothetical protein